MHSILIATLLLIGLAGASALLWTVTRFRYDLTASSVRFRWYFAGIVPIDTFIPLQNISTVSLVKIRPFALMMGPTFTFWGKPRRQMVAIEKTAGLIRVVFLSPPDAEDFVRRVRAALVLAQSQSAS